jgi:hypothetical protein
MLESEYSLSSDADLFLLERQIKTWREAHMLRVTDLVKQRRKDVSFRAESGEPKNNNINSPKVIDDINMSTNEEFDNAGNVQERPLAHAGVETHLSLEKFFERPILISSFTITPSSNATFRIKPYSLWSLDQTVRAKLSHYSLFRGDLKIRIVFNSTRQHYGAMLVSNQPYADANNTLKSFDDGNGIIGSVESRKALNCYLSQSPERVVLKYGTDNSYEMDIPFIYPKQAARLHNATPNTVIASSTEFDELADISTLYFSPLNALKVVNADFSTNIQFQIYAMCANVTLGPPTSTDIDIAAESGVPYFNPYMQYFQPYMPQMQQMAVNNPMVNDAREAVKSNSTVNSIKNAVSGVVPDEYADEGPVTQIASAVANISSKVQDLPIIGPVARATNMVSSGVAKVAKVFGFSKPVNIDPIALFKPIATTNMAWGSGKDTSMKLSMDPKQEVTIQPMGGEESIDPMAINYITSRESYFETLTWDTSDVPRTTILGVFPISPMIYGGVGGQYLAPTAMAFAALPFRHWRGTISFRFEVIASQFHRGKFIVVYEPNVVDQQLIIGDNSGSAKTNKLNQQYLYVMDIEKERDVTIDIGYIGDTLYKRVGEDAAVPLTYKDTTTPYNERQVTGFIYVKPLTNLTSPTVQAGAGEVDINVYAFSDDLELAEPNRPRFNRDVVTAESKVNRNTFQDYAEQRKEGTNFRTGPRVLINKVKTDHTNASSYHFGEKIVSFRQYLKREELTGVHNISTASGGTKSLEFKMYPIDTPDTLPRIQNNAGTLDSLTVPLAGDNRLLDSSNSGINLFNYLKHGYLFCKGSYRHKLVFDNNLQFRGNINVARDRVDNTRVNAGDNITMNFVGQNAFHRNINEFFEVEIPYYSYNMFELVHSFKNSDTPYSRIFSDFREGFRVRMELENTSQDFEVYDYTHSGEDFTFFRFQGAPHFNFQNVNYGEFSTSFSLS